MRPFSPKCWMLCCRGCGPITWEIQVAFIRKEKGRREAINKAREQVAHMIGADPTEIYFTSGGTESNNAWLKGFKGRYLFTTEVEHDSVLEPLYQNDGACPVNHLELNKDGSVNLEEFEQLLSEFDNTGDAASIMWVNNELGTVNPMKKIGALCKKYNMLFHADAVQAAGHVPMNVKDCGIDFCSLSGHKFGAPLGVGVLYISRSVDKHPWILGGGQENGLRGGTENVPGIVGIGKAAGNCNVPSFRLDVPMERIALQFLDYFGYKNAKRVLCEW